MRVGRVSKFRIASPNRPQKRPEVAKNVACKIGNTIMAHISVTVAVALDTDIGEDPLLTVHGYLTSGRPNGQCLAAVQRE